MGLLSKLLNKMGITRSEQVVVESPPSSLSTWLTLLDSQALSGQPSVLSKRVQNSTEFMDTLQGLILEKSRLEREEAQMRSLVAAQPLMPHGLYNPRLYHDGIQWVCVWGAEAQSKVVGRGNCPQEALGDFDAAWTGTKGTGDE